VREFVEATFERLGLDHEKYVEIDPRYFRPAEVDLLLGDAAKARQAMGWEPKVSFEKLVEMMVAHDWELAKEERVLVEHRKGNAS